MISNQEKARIFGMYLGAECIYNGNRMLVFSPNYCATNNAQLLLTPLSAITDEDAIVVAELLWSGLAKVSDKYKFQYAGSAAYLGKGAILFHLFEVGPWGDRVEFDNTFTRKLISEETRPDGWLAVFDFLRSRSYALPYKGQSLFDLQLAIDKTTIK